MNRSGSKLVKKVMLSVAVAALLAGWSGSVRPVVAENGSANLVFHETTSQQDTELIAEGIRLAQDFFATMPGESIDSAVHVNTRPGLHAENAETVAFSMGRSIVIYTGSPGWMQSSPATKLATVVHEYTHYYQFMRAGDGRNTSAAWFEEGIADYLALTALDQMQIVDRESIASWFATTLIFVPPALALSELESHQMFGSLGATSYPFAYFAVQELLEGKPLDVVDKYYGLLAKGASFDQAFSASFGISPARYYRVVDEQLSSLTGSAEMPGDIGTAEGVESASPVRVVAVPENLRPGEQALVLARTVVASNCTLFLQPVSSGDGAIERRTFADGDGDVFWLVTIPEDMPTGDAILFLDCGLDPVDVSVEIAA